MMPPDDARRIPPDAARILAEVDNHVRAVAGRTEPGSDANVLAYAIHNLITGIKRLHEE